MQLQRTDWIDKYEKSIDEIAAVGADTVQFVVDARQENGKSSRIYLDMRMTPTPEQLARLIKHAKDKKPARDPDADRAAGRAATATNGAARSQPDSTGTNGSTAIAT